MGEAGVGATLRAGLLAALLAACVAGCGRREKHESGAARDSSAARVDSANAYVNPVEAPEPEPARPTGPPIGRSDLLINSIRPALAEWVAMWRAAIPGFAVDSLWRAKAERWSPSWAPVPASFSDENQTYPFEDEMSAKVFTITSPDSALDLQIDTYQMISELGAQPDSRSALYDRQKNRETEVAFSGTMGGQHWGRWLNTKRFVLGGWSASEYGHWMSGWLSVYSLSDSSVVRYVAHAVADTTFERYRGAWESWAHKRYLALRPRP